MDIKNLAQSFTDLAELQNYANGQYKLIIDLSKKLNKLEEENKHLKKLLDSTVPNLSNTVPNEYLNISDEEGICRAQLKLLRDMAIERELGLDEAKRVEIYTKILNTIKNKETDKIKPISQLNDADLVSLIDQNIEDINTKKNG